MSAFDTTPRARLTDQQRAAIFLRAEGRCYICERKLRPGDKWDVEHKTALMNGGSNDDDNLAVACDWCHPVKTRADHKVAAKARAVATKHVVPNGSRVKRGPPMLGTKASGWRKKLNGTTEKR